MIFDYNSFLESLNLSQINEAILYYSPDLRKYLNKLRDSSDIAKDLLDIETQDVKPDTTFINLDKEGYLSFITSANAIKLIDSKWPDGDLSSLLKERPNRNLFELICIPLFFFPVVQIALLLTLPFKFFIESLTAVPVFSSKRQ